MMHSPSGHASPQLDAGGLRHISAQNASFGGPQWDCDMHDLQDRGCNVPLLRLRSDQLVLQRVSLSGTRRSACPHDQCELYHDRRK